MITKHTWKVILLIITLFMPFLSDTEESKIEWYRFKPKNQTYVPTVSIRIECNRKNELLVTTKKETIFGNEKPNREIPMPVLETIGNKDIDLHIQKEVGFTYFAGLKFYDSTKINIWDDGTLEVDRAGIRARSEIGTLRLIPGNGFTPLQNINVQLRKDKGIEIVNKTNEKIKNAQLLFKLSGKSKEGDAWISKETNVEGIKVFLLYKENSQMSSPKISLRDGRIIKGKIKSRLVQYIANKTKTDQWMHVWTIVDGQYVTAINNEGIKLLDNSKLTTITAITSQKNPKNLLTVATMIGELQGYPFHVVPKEKSSDLFLDLRGVILNVSSQERGKSLTPEFLGEFDDNSNHVKPRVRISTKNGDLTLNVSEICYPKVPTTKLSGKEVKTSNQKKSLKDMVKKADTKDGTKSISKEDTGQVSLVKIAKNAEKEWSRKSAVEKLDSNRWQDVLADIAKNDKSPFVRCAAVSKVNPEIGQDLLADIASNDIRSFVRKEALLKLKNQKLISEIAKNDKDRDVRLVAVKKLDPDKWQDILADIAKNDDNEYVRVRALEKLNQYNWQELFASIAKNDKHDWVRKEAVERLDSKRWQVLLADVAKNNRFFVSEEAIKKLTDPNLLLEICNNAKDGDVQVKALGKLDPNNYQEVLADFSTNHKDSRVRKEAVARLDSKRWQDLFLSISKNDEEMLLVRTKAIEKLDPEKNQKFFEKIAAKDKSINVRIAAIEKIKNKKFLAKIAIKDKSKSVCKAAEKRLKELEKK